MEFILASASPRRKSILELFSHDFVTIVSDIEEKVFSEFSPQVNSMHIAYQKANSLSFKENAIILACDTVVAIDGQILGKPMDSTEANYMLRLLSDRIHSVVTGFCIIDTIRHKIYVDYVETKVFFNKLSEEKIEKYISTCEPYDKAGGYGIQGVAGIFVKKIEGDYFNVVGLPISRISQVLSEQFDFNIY